MRYSNRSSTHRCVIGRLCSVERSGLRAPNKQNADDAERAARATQMTLMETWHSRRPSSQVLRERNEGNGRSGSHCPGEPSPSFLLVLTTNCPLCNANRPFRRFLRRFSLGNLRNLLGLADLSALAKGCVVHSLVSQWPPRRCPRRATRSPVVLDPERPEGGEPPSFWLRRSRVRCSASSAVHCFVKAVSIESPATAATDTPYALLYADRAGGVDAPVPVRRIGARLPEIVRRLLQTRLDLRRVAAHQSRDERRRTGDVGGSLAGAHEADDEG